jgi:putative ABC transport system permease protein
MDWLRELRRRLGMLWYGRQYDADLEEEMRLHLKLRQQEHLESGMAADALAAARRRFGNVAVLREESRSEWGWGWFEHLVQDVHYGARLLLRSPGFPTIAVLTLALGIGANTAIFSVLDGILLSPLPYEQPDRLVVMNHNDSLLNLIDIRRQQRTFTRGGGINTEAMDYTGGTEPVQVHAGYVDAGFLDTLGVPPMLGRIISPEEDVRGGPHVAVLSYRFWQKYLSSDPHVLGRTIPLSGSFYTVIGVMPKSFSLPREHADVFVSLWVAYPEAAPVRGVHFIHTYWRRGGFAALVRHGP